MPGPPQPLLQVGGGAGRVPVGPAAAAIFFEQAGPDDGAVQAQERGEPGAIEELADLVVPVWQCRGLFHHEYRGTTERDHPR